jgi:hypothetical protein
MCSLRNWKQLYQQRHEKEKELLQNIETNNQLTSSLRMELKRLLTEPTEQTVLNFLAKFSSLNDDSTQFKHYTLIINLQYNKPPKKKKDKR